MNILEALTSGRPLKKSLRRGQTSIKRQKLKRGAVCAVCHISTRSLLIIHHIIPIEELGDTSDNNCVVLCMNCHAVVTEVRREWKKGGVPITVENARQVYSHLTDSQLETALQIATALSRAAKLSKP